MQLQDLVCEAEAAQRAGDWPRAATLWRRAAEATDDAEREQHAKRAAWCDDMAALVAEPRPT